MLILNSSPTRFANNFLRMICTLHLKTALRGTVHLQEFIALKLRKEEGTFSRIKFYQSFHQRHIFIKMETPLLILLRITDSKQPHRDKLRFMVLMANDHIRMSMSELNDKDYFLPVLELEDDKNQEGPGDDDTPEYLSDDEDVSLMKGLA